MNLKKLSEDIFYVGVNDRRTHLFENMWPLPYGIAYNAYLIKDEKNILVDTVEAGKTDQLLDMVQQALEGGTLDYLVINHTEPDHSGAIRCILAAYPDLTVVGNRNTFKFIEGFYGPLENKLLIAEGDELDLGKHKLKFYMAPMVHWPETMMTFDETDGVLFSGDAFGSFRTLDGSIFDDELDLELYEDEMRRYYSNIVGKYGRQTQAAITKLKDLPIKIIASTHGPVFRSDINFVLSRYDKWSRYETEPGVVIIYGSMYGHTEEMADHIARKLVEYGVKHVRIHDVSKSHPSYIISDVWKYTGVLIASPAYNNGVYPGVKVALDKFIERKVPCRPVGVFGISTWSGGGVKGLKKMLEELNWNLISDSHEAKYTARENDYENLDRIAKDMAGEIV